MQQLVADAETAYDSYLTVDVVRAVESFVDDLSNWYIRRSRRRFYSSDEAAFRTLWTALVQLVRVFAPIMPFLAEHLWQRLVTEPLEDAPRVGLSGGLSARCAAATWTRRCSSRSNRHGGSSSSGAAPARRRV